MKKWLLFEDKNMKRVYHFFLVCLTLFFLSVNFSCNKINLNKKRASLDQPISKPVILRLNIADDPSILDPRKARNLQSHTLLKMLFEGLTRIGKKEIPELALADKLQISDDLKKYTFHLRDSFWTNGDLIKASDFIYAWKKVLNPKFLSDNAYQLYVIKNAKAVKEGSLSSAELGIRALDAHTIEVELENPTPYFLELLAFPCFFPVNEKLDEQNLHWTESVETYVSNGPFRLVKWKNNDELIVEKNPSYWDESNVKISRIEMVMVHEDIELNMYEKNALHWAGSPFGTLSLAALENLKKKDLLHTKSVLGTYFIRVNIDKPPFDNLLLRKAFALAINRKMIVDHVTQGNQIPATGFVPPILGLQNEAYFQDAATEKAKSLFDQVLKERGITRENVPKITLTYASNERTHLLAQTLQQHWFEAFGINIHLEAVESKSYFDRISKKDYQLSTGSWLADFNDPINFLEVFKYKNFSTNNTNWEDSNYSRLLDESSRVLDADLRKKVLFQSEKILMDQMPIIPIYHYTMLYLHDKGLKDVLLSSLGSLDFKWAYMEDQK